MHAASLSNYYYYTGLSQEPTPTETRLTVDEESSTTFSCSGMWGLRRSNSISSRFCNLAERQRFESMEDLIANLSLTIEWEIDGLGVYNSTRNLALSNRGIQISTNCTINAEQLYDILRDDRSYCRNRIEEDLDLIPKCTSVISIRRVLANNNVQLRCSIRPKQCEGHHDHDDNEFADFSTWVRLRLQGMMAGAKSFHLC